MAETISILIDEQGNVQVEGHGFVGHDCTKLTSAIEEAIGDVTSKKLKPEFHRQKTMLRKVGA